MVEIVYAQTRVELDDGQIQRNPRFFNGVEAGVTRALLVGAWPEIEAAHRSAGLPVERLDAVIEVPEIIASPADLIERLGERIVPREGRGDVALVIGSAGCVWDDVQAALELGVFHGVVGCNHAGIYWPGQFDAWVSLHADKFKLWAAKRAAAGLPRHGMQLGTENTLANFDGQKSVGSSGLYSLKVALVDLGFDRAVLCGVPITREAGHFDDLRPWKSAAAYRAGWKQALPLIKDRARSLSGWTADLIGRPDAEWVANG